MSTTRKKYMIHLTTMCECKKSWDTNQQPPEALDVMIVDTMKDLATKKKTSRCFVFVAWQEPDDYYYVEMPDGFEDEEQK
tara:strand:- start:2715 stop:2954 length:240 start_codon:yes stop_codon:yes gene_type:complete